MEKLILDILSDAMSHNKYLTSEYLLQFPVWQIINFTHPMFRGDYFYRLNRLKEKDNA